MRTDRIKALVVTGGRGFDRRTYVLATLDRLDELRGPIEVVAHGDAVPPKGISTNADKLSGLWARTRNRVLYVHPAVWKPADPNAPRVRRERRSGRLYDPMAGPLRNAAMLRERRPDAVLAFPGDRGTRDCINQARGLGIEVIFARDLLTDDEEPAGLARPG